MATLLELPEEIFGQICRNAGGNRSLLNLSLASKRCRSRVEPHFYRSILLHSIDSETCASLVNELDGIDKEKMTDSFVTWRGLERLLPFLSASPSIASSVKDLKIVCFVWSDKECVKAQDELKTKVLAKWNRPDPKDDWGEAFLDALLASLLAITPGLDLEVQMEPCPLPLLTRLSLCGRSDGEDHVLCGMDVQMIQSLLHALPCVEELSLAHSFIYDGSEEIPRKSVPSGGALDRMFLDCCNLQKAFATLESLLKVSAGLKSLYISIEVSPCDCDGHIEFDRLPNTLWNAVALVPTLQILHLEWDWRKYYDEKGRKKRFRGICRYKFGNFSTLVNLSRLYVNEFWIELLVDSFTSPQTRAPQIWSAMPPRLEELGIFWDDEFRSSLIRAKENIWDVLPAAFRILEGHPSSLRLLVMDMHTTFGRQKRDSPRVVRPPVAEFPLIAPLLIEPRGQVDIVVNNIFQARYPRYRERHLWAYTSEPLRKRWQHKRGFLTGDLSEMIGSWRH